MLLLASAAIAATQIGWPCGRLNWAWRNVWSTCSINSYLPANGPFISASLYDIPPLGIRVGPVSASQAPLNTMSTTNFNVNPLATTAVPQSYCAFEAATDGTAPYVQNNYLRNRCRRAIDAYGAITAACQLPPQTAGNRGPIVGTTLDWQPQPSHQPHVSNVNAITAHYRQCFVGTNPNVLYRSPSTTCPGLLGWFTVVYNSCGFTSPNGIYAAGATPSTPATVPQTLPLVTPLGGSLSPVMVNNANAGKFTMCGAAVNPGAWNVGGPVFRSTRCRKALDQFGRTALRCTNSAPNGAGYADPLKVMAGYPTALTQATPMGFAQLAPACN